EVHLTLVVRDEVVVALLEGRDAILVGAQLDYERADAFDAGLHVEEILPHVRVADDLGARGARILEVLDARALLALLGVVEGVQVRAAGDAETLDADADAREIHEHEHLAHALMLDLADELADA